MDYTHISGLNHDCSKIILGTSNFSPEHMSVAFDMLDTFVESGGNTIDTAYLYGHGKSERTLGKWLQSSQKRKDIVIISKGGHHYVSEGGSHDGSRKRVTPEDITHDLMESLERLQVDYIDLYLLHRDDTDVPVSELMDMLQEHMNAGLIRANGVSNWTYQRTEEANAYAVKKGYSPLIVNSPSLSLAKINEPRWPGTVYIDQDYADWHTKTQMPLFSWASQASGFFSGRFSPEITTNEDIVRVYYSDENWERLRRAEQLAKQLGNNVTANQVALAYVLNQPFPACAVIGPQNTEELCSSFKALDIQLTSEEKNWLNLMNS